MPESRDDRKENIWKVDERLVHSTGIKTTVYRFAAPLKPLITGGLFLLLFAYPFLLVYVGIAYGWIAFWSSLAGCFLAVGVVVSKTGYGRNFDRLEGSSAQRLAGLAIAFVAIVGFYLGLFQFKILMVPILLGTLATAILIAMSRSRL